MPAPLTGSDALLMRRLEVSRFRRLLPPAMVFLAGFLAFVVVLGNEPVPRCSPQHPCQPDPGSSAVAALLIGVMVLAFLQPWLAALAAVGAVGTVLWHNQNRAELATNRTGTIIVIVAALWCLVWAALSRRRTPSLAWQPELGPVPAPQRPVRTWRLGLLAGLLLVALGGAIAWYGTQRIAHVEAQQRVATVVTARVVAHLDKTVLQVAYPPGQNIDIPVINSQIPAYPIGGPVQLQVDDAGLRQLVTEPYDGSFFHAYALLSGLAGAGLVLFSLERTRPRRRLLRRPQPASAVFVRRRSDHVLIFAGDAGPTDRPFVELPVRDDLAQLAGLTSQPTLGNPMMRPPEPAVLHGTPVPGNWCTVTLGSVTLAPKGPLRTAQDMLPFGNQGPTTFGRAQIDTITTATTTSVGATTAGTTTAAQTIGPETIGAAAAAAGIEAARIAAGPADEPGEPPLTPNEISQMRPDDAAAPPREVRRHRLPRPIAYGLTLLVPVVGLGALRPLRDLGDGWGLFASVVVVVGLANYASWRMWFRPVVAWSGGGMTTRTAWGRRTISVPWPEVSAVRGVGHYIRLDTYGGVVELTMPWESWLLSGRTPAQLLLALRRAKLQAQTGLEPPPAKAPGDVRDAVLLVLITIGTVYGLLAYLSPTVVSAR